MRVFTVGSSQSSPLQTYTVASGSATYLPATRTTGEGEGYVTTGPSTQPGRVPAHPASIVSPAPTFGVPAGRQESVLAWLNGEDSKRYEGRWVALDASNQVLSAVSSPREFAQDVARRPDVTILFVLPRNVAVAG